MECTSMDEPLETLGTYNLSAAFGAHVLILFGAYPPLLSAAPHFALALKNRPLPPKPHLHQRLPPHHLSIPRPSNSDPENRTMAKGNSSGPEKGFISVEDFIRTRDSGKLSSFIPSSRRRNLVALHRNLVASAASLLLHDAYGAILVPN